MKAIVEHRSGCVFCGKELAAPTPMPFERTARANVSRVSAHGQGEPVTSYSLLKCPETEERERGSRVRIPLPPPFFPRKTRTGV